VRRLMLAALLVGCGGPARPDGGAPARSGSPPDACAPSGWVVDAMVSRELGPEDRPPGAAVRARLLRWRIKEDDRPLRVESAIVQVEVRAAGAPPHWLLLEVFRHPRDAHGHADVWRLSQIADTPVTGVRRFAAPPTAAELERFLAEGGWNDISGFRELGSGVCAEPAAR
jgi:hypothetical protein